MQRKRLRTQRGVSLVEQMLAAVFSGMLVLMTLPGLQEAKDKRRLDSVASQIESELQHARSQAVASGETVRVGFSQSAQGSCYVIHTGSPRQCTCQADGTASCSGDAQALRTVAQPQVGGIQMRSSAKEIGFDATHGTVTPTTTLQLQNERGDQVHLVVNVMGRIRSCSPAPATNGYARC